MTETIYQDTQIRDFREPTRSIDRLFVQRWSPRAMTGEALDQKDLEPLFEAARWAPSSYNSQPWRFLVGCRGTPLWDRLFGYLVEFNQGWANDAGALVLVLSHTRSDDGDDLPTHSFDTGAAWENLALEGRRRDLVVHGMAGFDQGRARADLGLSPEVKIEAMIAIGHPGSREELSDELAAKERPSQRLPRGRVVAYSLEDADGFGLDASPA